MLELIRFSFITMSIQKKFFLVLLLVTLFLVSAMYVFVNWSMDKGLLDYVNYRELSEQKNLAEQLAMLYVRDGRWDFLQDNYPLWDRILRTQKRNVRGVDTDNPLPLNPQRQHQRHPPRPPGADRHRAPPPPHRRHPGLHPVAMGFALVDTKRLPIVGMLPVDIQIREIPVIVSDQTVGWLLAQRREQLTDQFDLKWIARQRDMVLIAAGVLIAVVTLLAWLMARHILLPLKQLASATSLLTQGHYTLKLAGRRQDELGQLQRDFNELANSLKANETARKRWLADISHELRTPLSVIRAEIEAMQDGIREMDAKALQSMAEEHLRISKLVDDLHELSNAELGALRYRKQWIDLTALLNKALARHTVAINHANLQLSMDIPDRSSLVYIDEDRFNQVVDNLISNSLKYTDQGGQLHVSLKEAGNQIKIRFEDSEPVVSDQDLPHLCDYLYRVDDSRSRDTGGSGLGLSICQRIIEAHQGKLSLSASSLGGLCVDIVIEKENN